MNDIHKADVQAIHHKEADEYIHDFAAYHFEIPLLIVKKGVLAELLDDKKDSDCNEVWTKFAANTREYLYPNHY